ncbi:hypothetical protein GCM10027088_15310 [Nocardia goodfellowii]
MIDIGLYEFEHPVLVVVRPFASGGPLDNLRHHLAELTGVLGDLAIRGAGAEVAEDLVKDYASPWLAGWTEERRLAARISIGEWAGLVRVIDEHGAELRASAVRLTRADNISVYHGDLHGRNLILSKSRQCTVIDWDEAGFSRRPADAGKALWLSCRRERGDFALHPRAVHSFVEQVHACLHLPYRSIADVAKLGAIWFLPRHSHIALLEQRDANLVAWYLDWISRFWLRFRHNLDLITRTAEALDQDAPTNCLPPARLSSRLRN